MQSKIVSTSAKKLVKMRQNLVLHLTKEAKKAGWNDKTIVKVTLIEEDGKNKILLEKGMSL